MLCARARSASAAEAGGWRFGDSVGTVTVERRRGLTSDAGRGMENEGISCVASRRRACAHRLGGGGIHVNSLGDRALGGQWAWTRGNEGTRARGFESQARAGTCAQSASSSACGHEGGIDARGVERVGGLAWCQFSTMRVSTENLQAKSKKYSR